MRVLGLISGTSADGIDAALCEITGTGDSLETQVLAFECLPYAPELAARVAQATTGEINSREVAHLNVILGQAFALAAVQFFRKHGAQWGKVDLIASHGQTVGHWPDIHSSLQLGDGAVIAARTGITTVSDFRSRDLAEGGQGAPLVPYADWVLLRDAQKNRVILNVGGIANCTILPKNCGLSDVRGWDTGPGNMLLDEIARRLLGRPFDENGAFAAQGKVARGWLRGELEHPFLRQDPPKSTGREQFGATFAQHFIEGGQMRGLSERDILATATALTARSVDQSLQSFTDLKGTYQLIVGGGGAFNPTLLGMLRAEMPHVEVLRCEDFGIRSDAKEALAFAILGYQALQNVPTSVPGATGAKKAAVLGKISPA